MIGELFQPMHLLVIAVVALFMFGPSKLPEIGKTLGKTLRELREGINDAQATTVEKPTQSTTASSGASSTDETK